MKTIRGYLAALIGLLLLVTMLAIAIQPLMPWIIALFLLAIIYGVLIRD